jgi:hypothetical protein
MLTWNFYGGTEKNFKCFRRNSRSRGQYLLPNYFEIPFITQVTYLEPVLSKLQRYFLVDSRRFEFMTNLSGSVN